MLPTSQEDLIGGKMLKWSENITYGKPMLLAPEEVGEFRDRAFPYADTPPPDMIGEPFIRINKDCVAFWGQKGPVKDVGVNGCQIDDILTFVLGTLQTFNKKFPCRENSLAITKLEECLHWLNARRQDRELRGVEGRDMK